MTAWKMASWMVRFRAIRDVTGTNYRLLGDVDEGNTPIHPTVERALRQVAEEDEHGRPVLAFADPAPTKDRQVVAAWIEHNRYGVPGRIYDGPDPVFSRQVHHGDGVRQLVMLHLPDRWKEGLLTICTQERTAAKNAVRDALNRLTREEFGLITEIEAQVPAELFREAIRRNRVRRVQFVASDKLKGRFGDIEDFGDEEAVGRITTELSPQSARSFLRAGRFQRFLAGDRAGVVRFNDTDYDVVKVTLRLQNGAERTITIGEELSSAHPLWVELDNVAGNVGDELVEIASARLREQAPTGWPL